MRDDVDTQLCWFLISAFVATLATVVVLAGAGLALALIAVLVVVLPSIIWLQYDDIKRQRRLFKLMIEDPSELRVQQRLHELAVEAQERFAENEVIQQKTPAELDSLPDWELSYRRRHAHQLANDAKSNFWALHNYLVGYFGYKFPYTKIGEFAANNPREKDWLAPEEVPKGESTAESQKAVAT